MLIVYFDASNTSPDQIEKKGTVKRKLTVVTACAAPLEAWLDLELRWKRCLNVINEIRESHGLKPIVHVRRSELEVKEDLDLRNTIISWMTCFLITHEISMVSRGCGHNVWDEARKRNELLNGRYTSLFTFCVQQCFHSIELWANRIGQTDDRAYILEDGDGEDEYLKATNNYIINSPKLKERFRYYGMYLMEKRTGNIRPIDDATPPLNISPPIHPLSWSDGIAWEHRRISERKDLWAANPSEDKEAGLIWALDPQDDVANYDLETLSMLDLDSDGMALNQ